MNHETSLYFGLSTDEKTLKKINDLFGFDVEECEEYRGVEISIEKNKGEVTGKCGSRNREYIEDSIEKFKTHDGFLYEEDCDDPSFSRFLFNLDCYKWKKFVDKHK